MPEPEQEPRPPREGFGPYPRWVEPTPEEKQKLWRSWGWILGVLAAIGLIARALGA